MTSLVESALGHDRELGEHGVVDEVAHLDPLTLLGEPVELGLGVLPAVVGEHALVGGRRAVEGDLLAGAGGGLLHLVLVGAGDDERR